jgi:hypothetical protein
MYCRKCGAQNPDTATACVICKAPLGAQQEYTAPQVKAKTSGMAIASLILGILGLMTCGLTGIPGLIVGLVGLNKINRSQGQLGGSGMAIAGSVMSGISLMFLMVMPAILFPVFARAREAARKSSCQSNLKELGCALALYCADNNDVLPSSALCSRQKKWDEASFIRFAGGNNSACWVTPLSPNMRNKDIMWCPSDNSNRNDPNAPVSYYWKAAVDYAWYQGFRKMSSSFDFPADQVVLYEHNGWHWGQKSQGLTDGVAINCLFMDVHVASKRILQSGYTEAENPPSPLPNSGAGEPAWFNYDYANNKGTITGKLWNPKTCGDMLP